MGLFYTEALFLFSWSGHGEPLNKTASAQSGACVYLKRNNTSTVTVSLKKEDKKEEEQQH